MIIKNNKNCNIKINDNAKSTLSAKDMFEKLGYEYFNNGLRITYQNYEISECKLIEFNLNEKKMWLADDSEEVVELSFKEIKAINQQIDEFGWHKC